MNKLEVSVVTNGLDKYLQDYIQLSLKIEVISCFLHVIVTYQV